MVKAIVIGNLAGIGRVVGDYSIVCMLSDICVKPEFQGNGIGLKIVNELKKLIEEGVKEGEKRFYIVHYPQQPDGTYKKHIKNPSAMDNMEMFKENDADIYLYGHTHTFSVNNIDDKWYINGSFRMSYEE